jgi:hypothetical protein
MDKTTLTLKKGEIKRGLGEKKVTAGEKRQNF